MLSEKRRFFFNFSNHYILRNNTRSAYSAYATYNAYRGGFAIIYYRFRGRSVISPRPAETRDRERQRKKIKRIITHGRFVVLFQKKTNGSCAVTGTLRETTRYFSAPRFMGISARPGASRGRTYCIKRTR